MSPNGISPNSNAQGGVGPVTKAAVMAIFQMFRSIAIAFAFVALLAQSVSAQDDDTARRLIGSTLRSTGKVSVGPDAFPYLIAFQSSIATIPGAKAYAMSDLAKLALSDTAGIVVYDAATTEPQPVAVFSLGSVIALANNRWQPIPTDAPTPGPGDRVTLGTPSFAALPVNVRRALASFMRTQHVATPKVALIAVLDSKGKPKLPFLMSANIPESAFKTDTAWFKALVGVEWYVPPAFSMIHPPSDKATFDAWFKGVEPLEVTASPKKK